MNENKILELLYNNLTYCITDAGKKKKESLLLDFMKISSNSRMSILNDSSEEFGNVDVILINNLITNNLIRENEYGKYFISARGIWEVEKKKFDIIDEIVSYFDLEYFVNKSINKSLGSREKVVILTLIAIRAFDAETSLGFKGDDNIKDSCALVMDILYNKLLELNVIKKSKDGLYGNPRNEHKVTNVMRHTVDLPKKTKMLYVNGYNNDQRFFLNIANDDELIREELKYLLSKVFDGARISYSESKEFSKLLVNIAYQEGPNIVGDFSKSFIKTEYDEIISSSFEEAIMGI